MRKEGETMKYYSVTCVRAHTGAGNIDCCITFYYKASNAIEAIRRGQAQPGVKHTRIPLKCVEITEEEYREGRTVSAYRRAHAR